MIQSSEKEFQLQTISLFALEGFQKHLYQDPLCRMQGDTSMHYSTLEGDGRGE